MSSSVKVNGAAGCLVAVIFILLALFLTPFLLMLGLGALHGYAPEIPALGFWACFWIVFVLNLIAGIFRKVTT